MRTAHTQTHTNTYTHKPPPKPNHPHPLGNTASSLRVRSTLRSTAAQSTPRSSMRLGRHSARDIHTRVSAKAVARMFVGGFKKNHVTARVGLGNRIHVCVRACGCACLPPQSCPLPAQSNPPSALTHPMSKPPLPSAPSASSAAARISVSALAVKRRRAALARARTCVVWWWWWGVLVVVVVLNGGGGGITGWGQPSACQKRMGGQGARRASGVHNVATLATATEDAQPPMCTVSKSESVRKGTVLKANRAVRTVLQGDVWGAGGRRCHQGEWL